MDKSIQRKTIREDANEKGVGSHNRSKERVCTKEGESVSIIKGRKRGSKRVCSRAAKEGVHLTIQVTTDGASILCRKEGWEEADGTRLPVFG